MKKLTKEVMKQITTKMDELESKEAEHGVVLRQLSDQELAGVAGGILTAGWSIERPRGG